MKKMILAVVFSLGLISVSAMAASGSGNGGDGVIIKGKPYLLDLVEAGVQLDPYFKNPKDFSVKLCDKIISRVGLDLDVATLVAAKVKEIDGHSPTVGFFLKEAMFSLSWRFLNQELIDVKDDFDSVLEFKDLELVQMAVRQGYNVTINLDSWKKADAKNRAALIMHEVIYSLAPLESVTISGVKDSARVQIGSHARAVNGTLFMKSFSEGATQESMSNLLESNRYTAVGGGGASFADINRSTQFGYVDRAGGKDTFYFGGFHDDYYPGLKSYSAWTSDASLESDTAYLPMVTSTGATVLMPFNVPELTGLNVSETLCSAQSEAELDTCTQNASTKVVGGMDLYTADWVPSF